MVAKRKEEAGEQPQGQQEKLAAKLKQKDLYILSLQSQITQLKAVNDSLAGKVEDQMPGSQELHMIREQIRLLEEELRAKQDQHLIAIFGPEHLDQLQTLGRRVDYFDQTYTRIAEF